MLIEQAGPGTLNRVAQFQVYFLGMIQDVNMGTSSQRDTDLQLIDTLEEAQLEGKLPLIAKEEDIVTLTISKHGIKVLDKDKLEVLQRHPLHTVAQMVHYTDSFSRHNVSFKIGQISKTVFNCYLFQCHNEEQSQNICQSLKAVFDVISHRPP